MRNCRNCECLTLHNNQFRCDRNKDMGIIVDLDINKLDIPCHACEPKVYELENEYITPDKEKDLGYLEDNYDIRSKNILHKIVEIYK